MPHSGDLLKVDGAPTPGVSTEPIELGVFSEIGPLREVLVHAPGPEVDVMPPSLMQELLFDDIVYGPKARQEHAQFRAVLRRFGVTVHDTQDLLREALEVGRDAIPELIADLEVREWLDDETVEELGAMAPAELASALVEGLRAPGDDPDPVKLFRLSPIPNLLFSRDAQVVLGDRVVVSGMNHRARQREALLSRFVFLHHPRLVVDSLLHDFAGGREPWPRRSSAPTFEGGDLLVFNEGVVVVGVSQRTMESSVNRLVEKLRKVAAFHSLIIVPMPSTRSAMHLDTVFTRVSESECLVFPPMILPGYRETLSVICIDLRDPDDYGVRRPDLLDALRRVRVDLEPISCGGESDPIRQRREQWTDGANSFAVRPGVVLLYGRNETTAAEFAARGFEIVSTTSMKFEDENCLHDFSPGKKYVILVGGQELSRARGGPRCMTMPLVRERV